ncbi:LysR family transcriptional regulator [Verticiella sediminum]|nr:LysR family transcriptional regulator [Verticiella sediminum]
MKPTLRQLEAFCHVYRLGSLTQAAQAMHLTQSAMSVLVQQLEEALGMRLFDRTSRALRPTEAAHETYRGALRVLGDVDVLLSEARDLALGRRGVVHVGVATAVAATVLPDVMVRFAARHPGVRIEIHDHGPGELLEPVLAQRVAFCVGTPAGHNDMLVFEPLLRDRLSAICGPGHPLALAPTVRCADLAGHPVVTVRRGNGIRELVDGAMRSAGVALAPAWEVSYLATALAICARGLAVAVLPASLLHAHAPGGLVSRPLADADVARELYLITRKDSDLSAAARTLAGTFRDVLNEIAAPTAEAGRTRDVHAAALGRPPA